MRYQRLTLEHRYQIEALQRSEISIRASALNLGRSPSTISRELKRNRTERGYQAAIAQGFYLIRRKSIHPPLKVVGSIGKNVLSTIKKQWSPEQISGRFKRKNSIISHETIYRFIYRDFSNGGPLYLNLRRRRKRRRSHIVGKAFKRCGMRLKYPSMEQRPEIVDQRVRLGDYERDTLLGKFNGPVLLCIVDRVSKLTKLGKVEKINAQLTHEKTVKLLKGLTVHTITNDNGPEFANYEKTATQLKTKIFFTSPYASWQRGTNENTNGLIRQYFPKGTDFSLITEQQIKQVEDALNNRPRKSLGYLTPLEVHKRKSQALH